MADYDSSLPVRTETDGDVVAKVVDSAGTNKWSIDLIGRGKVNVADGNDNELKVNPDGSLNVNQVSATVGTDIHEFDTVSAGVPGTPSTVIDYTVTALKTLLLKSVQAAASGKARVELKTGPAASEVTKAVGFVSTASGEVQWQFPQAIEVAAGNKVLVIVTNRDNANADLYAWINGVEV